MRRNSDFDALDARYVVLVVYSLFSWGKNAGSGVARSRTRTNDLRITNALLYQLSYAGDVGAEVYHRCVPVQHENMTTRIVLLVVFGLFSTSPAWAAVDPETRGWTEEDRALAASDKPGSMAQPLALRPKDLKPLCRDLTPPPTELEASEPPAARRVFRVMVPTAKLKWETDSAGIALDRARPLIALDGWLRLQVLESPARFAVTGDEAKRLKARLQARDSALDLTFVVAEARELNPCFALAGSESYTMAVIPLHWTLRAGNAELAKMKAASYDVYAQWARPGKAKLRLSATADGAVSEKRLTEAVQRSARGFKRCANSVMSTAAGTFVVGLAATLTSDARLVNVRTEISSAEGLGPCFKRVLSGVRPPRPTRTTDVRVVVEVTRGS